MLKRAAQAADTRRRIIEATQALHGQRGVLRSKPADIAARADVSLATYYKYFPTIGDLVRACTGRGREQVPPPEPGPLAYLPPHPAARIPAMVRALFQYYETREPWLYVGWTEERLVPELQPIMEKLRALGDAFVRAALADAQVGREIRGVATALVTFWTWRTLRRDVGLMQEEVIRSVTLALKRLVAGSLQKGPRPRRGRRPAP